MVRNESLNLRYYPYYAALVACYFWLPVFYLYFIERVSIKEMLLLEAVYYACVVIAEVPSGYFSDRYGRKRTLLISSSALTLAYLTFFFAGGFTSLIFAQALLGIGYAFSSGTDTAFHADALNDAGKSAEYGEREAKIRSMAFIVAAGAVLVGSTVAMVETRYAYGLNALTALASFILVARMHEPNRGAVRVLPDQALDSFRGFRIQLGDCIGDLKNRALAWIFFYAVFMTILNHIPYEFYQSRIALWFSEDSQWPPLVSGLVLAVGQLLSAVGSRYSIWAARRLGERKALLATIVLQTIVMAIMAWFVHPVVVGVILLRGLPDALGTPILLSRVAEHVPSRRRATFLSLQSLGGRLSFSLWLLVMSAFVGGVESTEAVSRLLLSGAVLGGAGFLIFSGLARRA